MLELKRDALGRLTPLASGGQAHVHRAPDVSIPGVQGPFVYKQYRDGVIEGRRGAVRNSLGGLIRVREGASSRERLMIDGRSTWPVAIVLDDEGATGCLMQEIPPAFFRELRFFDGSTKRVPWEWSLHLQAPKDVAARGLPALTDTSSMYLLARVLQFAEVIHQLDVVVGDFSSANILVTVDPSDDRKCRPMFVDVDSYRRHSAVPAILQPHTPGWETPEKLFHQRRYKELVRNKANVNEIARVKALSRIQDKPSDVYKAALLIVRTLDGGPESGYLRNSETAVQRLRQLRGRRDADLVLTALRAEPGGRPTMSDLAKAFTGT